MRLLKLEVEGFRSLRRITWQPAPLNIVIGPNGGGKSNLLFALDAVATATRGDLDRTLSREGGLSPLLWDGQQERLRFRIRTSPIDRDRDIERDSLTYDFAMSKLGASSYRIESELLGNFYRVETGERNEPLKLLERNPRHAVLFDEQQRALVPIAGVREEETLLSCAQGPLSNNRLIAAYQKTIAGWSILREFPCHRGAAVRQPVIARRETQVQADGQNLVSVLHTQYSESREFKHAINKAMTDAFGDDFDELLFPPAGDQRIELRIRWKSLKREQAAAEMSAGTLRFLYLLTVLAAPQNSSLIAIDEAELGLHPAMLPIVADFAMKAAEKCQVILTTSTPALLDVFPEGAATTVVRREKGETILESLEGDALEDWLIDYNLEGGQSEEEESPEEGAEAVAVVQKAREKPEA
jgi:predicted ATPase